MPGLIQVSVTPAQVLELERDLDGIKNGVPRAVSAAINRTLTTGRSRIVKRVRQEVAIKAGTARESVGIRKATQANPEGFIVLSKKPIPLYEFSPNPRTPGEKSKKGGVSVRVRPGKGRELLKGTFIARMRSGHVGIFERKLVGGPGGKRAKRLPIKERFGPSLLGVFENAPGVAAEEIAALGPILEKNLSSQVQRLLAGQKPDESPANEPQ